MSEKLKNRQLEILKDLMTYTVPLEIGFFEKKFHKSARTIRYDINELKMVCNKYGVEIRYQTKQGFFIPASQKMGCSEILIVGKGMEKSAFLLDSDEERYKKLFLYFFSLSKNVTTDCAAEQFYISRSTLLRLLSKMEQYYEGRIQLVSRKYGGYELLGEELSLRKIALNIIAERFKGSYTPEDWYLLMPEPLKDAVSLQQLILITNGIKRVNAKFNVWISNTAFLNLLAYCIVRNFRYYYQNRRAEQAAEADTTFSYARDLLKEISYPGDQTERTEADYMQEILAENGIAARDTAVEDDRLKAALKEMLAYPLKEAEAVLGRMDKNSLYQDLYGHLKNSICLYQSQYGHEEENYTVIHEVRENYNSFYQAAVKCGRYLEKKLGMTFTETEICYIAVYIYKNCIEQKNCQKNVLVVCATGKGLSNLLTIRIQKVFPMLNVVGQTSPYQLSHQELKKDIDFVISTIPLSFTQPPVIKISRILSPDDISRIQEFLDYGELIDEIPLKQKDQASFGAKTDPFALSENQPECSRKELTYATNILSKLILTLLEYTSKFPEKYKLSQDALLGLIIHMSMAVPRWYEGPKQFDDYEAEYKRISQEHREVFEIMEKFFELVEQSLRVSIVIEEKMAFFLYVIKEDENEDVTN